MRHFTKYLFLCLAFTVLPSVIGAQTLNLDPTATPDGTPDDCIDIEPIEICFKDPDGDGVMTLNELYNEPGVYVLADVNLIAAPAIVGCPYGAPFLNLIYMGASTTSGVSDTIATNWTTASINGDPTPNLTAAPTFAPGSHVLQYHGREIIESGQNPPTEPGCAVFDWNRRCNLLITINEGLSPCLITVDSAPTCGMSNGRATVAAPTGGTAPYTYLWSDGQDAATGSGLSAISYSVTVTDMDGCESVCSIDLEDVDDLSCSVMDDDINSATCSDNSGSATISVTGGATPYSFSLNGTATTPTTGTTFAGLGAGTYTVVVTDNNGCTSECMFTVDAVVTGGIGVDFSNPASPVCTGFEGGTSALGAGVCTVTLNDIYTAINGATISAGTGLCIIHPSTCGPTGTNTFDVEIYIDGVLYDAANGAQEFGAGDYDIEYRVTDNCSGATATCDATYTITQDESDILDVLACNNSINATLSTECEVVVTADMMLEGNSTCYEGYSFVITDGSGSVLSGSTISSPGTYQVQVFDATGDNSCWGTIIAEDKIAPVIECVDIGAVSCTDDLTPGADLESGENLVGALEAGGPTLASMDSVVYVFNTSNATADATITDLSLSINISHTNITDLTAVLVSPDTMFTVFSTPLGSASNANCERDDIMATFSDDGNISYNLLDVDPTCRLLIKPSVLGNFQPEDSFSGFNGGDAQGQYKLIITDGSDDDETGMVVSASLVVRYATGDTIAYPTTGSYTPDPSSGEGCYTIDHEDGDCGPVRACYTDKIVDSCDGAIFQKVERTWTVWDASGNMAQDVCTFEIQGSDITNASLESTGMSNFDGLGGNPYFTCQDIFEMDENGNPSPSVTGRPRDISSNNMEFCGNIEMTYEDTRIDICPGSYKVVREWILIDWCSNDQPVSFNQIIKVTDEQPPITTCSIVDCFEVPIEDPFSCTTSFDVPAPIVLNECGGYTWSVSYLPASMVPGFVEDPDQCLQPDNALTAGLFIDVDVVRTDSDDTPITVTGLPLGQVWFRYRVVDDCGNESPSGAGACEIRVVDETEPTAVCDEHTTVSLGFNCEAEIRAETFDDLSWDNCSDIVLYEAMREGGTFGPAVRFGKSDLTNDVNVLLRVTDAAGNNNQCWASVNVQDKFQPIFTSMPADVTISCDFTDEQLQAAVGTVAAEDNCPGCYRIDGPMMGDPSQNSCGEGSVTVSWELFDLNQLDGDGNPLKVNTASQRISFENSNPFNESDIQWPSDRTDLVGCGDGTDPSNVGEPTYSNRLCDLIAVSYDDLNFYEVEGACLKILRTWTIIDWCQHNENVTPVTGKWTHIQILKVTDSQGPVLTNGTSRQFCADESCAGEINIDLIATDNCTPVSDILWSYTIDYDSDGSVDVQDGAVQVDSVLTLGGTHPIGVHAVSVMLTDNCSNVSDAYTFDITITDCLEPTPQCLSTSSVVVLPSSGSVEIWASDFELSSSDQCGGPLTFSFSANPEDQTLTFSCADLTDGMRRAIELEMWVHDESGNSDFCNVVLDLQDNGTGEGACPDVESPSALISGFIFTEQNEMVNNVAVQVTSAQPEFPINFTTSNTGDYTFNNLLTGYTYDVSSAKDDDHINGVSTLDIVLIQKHILGLSLLDSPYKIIAADADNNQYISAADLVWIRKLVLGLTTDYPNGQESWRFVDEDHNFTNQYNPFPYDEVVRVDQLDNNETNMNFMAVKIGDVNENANPNNFNTHVAEVRSNQTVEFVIEDKAVKTGEYVSIPVTAANFKEIVGFQFTLDFDNAAMEFAGFGEAALNITEANLGLVDVERGLLAVSWNDIKGNSFDADEVLFTVDFKASAATKLSDALAINSRVTNAEAYASDLSLVKTKLVFGDKETTFEVTEFELYQNNPNPFNNETTIGFNLPKAGDAVLSVFDVTGKRIIRIVEEYSKGYNEISLNRAELGIQGVMYYTLESEGFTATKKMVGVK